MNYSHWHPNSKMFKRQKKYNLSNTAMKALINRSGMYEIDLDELIEMYIKQGEKCCICSVKISYDNYDGDTWCEKPHVDHDHDTGMVRGFLCHKCNIGLGRIEGMGIDKLDIIKEYLSRGKVGEQYNKEAAE